MTARTINDKTIILRPQKVGKSANIYNAFEDECLLKIHNVVVTKSKGTSMLGLFNISKRPLTELIHLSQFPQIEPNQTYIIRSFSTGETSPELSLSDASPIVSATIDVKGWEILYAYPLSSSSRYGNFRERSLSARAPPKVFAAEIAVLGLVDKMTGPAAVINTSTYRLPKNHRTSINVTLKALGQLGIYISYLTTSDLLTPDNLMVLLAGKPVPYSTVRVEQIEDSSRGASDDNDNDKNGKKWKRPRAQLEIDLVAAWAVIRRGGLVSPSDGDEVEVEIIISDSRIWYGREACMSTLLESKKPWGRERELLLDGIE